MTSTRDSFLAAQSADPHDPVPMLVWADHLEEAGDLGSAEALRGLAGAGVPSLVALAVRTADVPNNPDVFGDLFNRGTGDGDGHNQPPDWGNEWSTNPAWDDDWHRAGEDGQGKGVGDGALLNK